MTYVYLLESVYYQGHHYVGITADLRQRLRHHNEGKSPHTRKFKPWNLVSYTAFADERTAYAFEKYLKSGSGQAFIGRHYFRKILTPPMTRFPPNAFDRKGFLKKLSAHSAP